MNESLSSKSFLDKTGLSQYDTLLKSKISEKDEETLSAAKEYAESLPLPVIVLPTLYIDFNTMELMQDGAGYGISFNLDENMNLTYTYNSIDRS